jgi:hypothetical protein
MSREFLVTKFVCATCGNNLGLTYELPTKYSNYAEGEPTGAAMVEQRIAIAPCKPCAEPLVLIRKSLAHLVAHGIRENT